MPSATNRFVTVTGDVNRTGEIPNDETAMTTLLDTLMKRNKQVQQTHFQTLAAIVDVVDCLVVNIVLWHMEESTQSFAGR